MNATAKSNGRRASGSETRRRVHITPVRCSDEERAELVRRAARSGLTVAAYLRSQALGTEPLRAHRRPQIEVQRLAQLLGQVGKIGSNLNQIAHHLNVDPFISVAERQALTESLKQLGTLRSKIMIALGRQP